MPQPVTLLTLGGLAMVGAALGVHLGYSAVGEINPLYYNEPAPKLSYADRAGYRSPSWAPSQTNLPVIQAAAPSDTAYPQEYYPQHDQVMDGYAASAATPAQYRPAQLVLEQVEPEPEPRAAPGEGLERYAYYPIETAHVQEVRVETAQLASETFQ